MTWEPEIEELRYRRELALRLGGEERVKRQHSEGRLTVRERIEGLVDPGSFSELGTLAGHAEYGDGQIVSFVPQPFVMGLGRIDGRLVCVGGDDFTVKGASHGSGRGGRAKGGHDSYIEDMAREYQVPLVLLMDGVGANVQGIGQSGYTSPPNSANWYQKVELLGLIPVATAVLGPNAGYNAGRSVVSHFSCMVKSTGQIFPAGPPVVRRALGVNIHKDDLGGTKVHCYVSGVIDNEAESEEDCFRQIRAFLSYMPSNVWEAPPDGEPTDRKDRREEALFSLVPRDRKHAYDMRRLLSLVLDDGAFFEIKPYYGKSIITALARLGGHVVGVIANDPRVYSGAMTAAAADKQGHFIDLCDCFHIPLLWFVDMPGVMIGPQSEREGALRHAIRALAIGARATVPSLAVMVRKCYGMGGAQTGSPERLNLRLAWPSAEWGGIPIEGGVEAAYRRELEAIEEPERRAARRAELERALVSLRSPFRTAEAFQIEEIIDPRDTRPLLIEYLEAALPAARRQLGPKPRYGVLP